MRPLLFDASALVSLFRGGQYVSSLWFDAEKVGVRVLVPATAIREANRELGADDSAWDALLMAVNLDTLDLTPAAALGASRRDGDLATAHAAQEAVATGATIVTAWPDAYDPVLPVAVIEE